MKHLFLLTCLTFLFSCAQAPKKSPSSSMTKSSEVAKTASKAKVEKMNEPQALNKKTAKSKKKLSEEELLVELTGKASSSSGERKLYLAVAEAFQNKKIDQVRSRAKEFGVRYPKSSLMDNVLYVAGLAEMENSQYFAAIKYFQRIETEFPRSDRARAARLSKALMYKRMNLETQSQLNLKQVQRVYPGSPEAYRAEAELKLMK